MAANRARTRAHLASEDVGVQQSGRAAARTNAITDASAGRQATVRLNRSSLGNAEHGILISGGGGVTVGK